MDLQAIILKELKELDAYCTLDYLYRRGCSKHNLDIGISEFGECVDELIEVQLIERIQIFIVGNTGYMFAFRYRK